MPELPDVATGLTITLASPAPHRLAPHRSNHPSRTGPRPAGRGPSGWSSVTASPFFTGHASLHLSKHRARLDELACGGPLVVCRWWDAVKMHDGAAETTEGMTKVETCPAVVADGWCPPAGARGRVGCSGGPGHHQPGRRPVGAGAVAGGGRGPGGHPPHARVSQPGGHGERGHGRQAPPPDGDHRRAGRRHRHPGSRSRRPPPAAGGRRRIRRSRSVGGGVRGVAWTTLPSGRPWPAPPWPRWWWPPPSGSSWPRPLLPTPSNWPAPTRPSSTTLTSTTLTSTTLTSTPLMSAPPRGRRHGGKFCRQPAAFPGRRIHRRRAGRCGPARLGGGPPPGGLTGCWLSRPAPAGPPATVGSAAAGFREAEGLSPLVTPNRSFYRIDEALITPSVDVGRWPLQVKGMVDAPFQLTYDDLLALPLVERHVTRLCVSNQAGGHGQVAGRAPGRPPRPGGGPTRPDPAGGPVLGRRLHGRLPGGRCHRRPLRGEVAVGMNDEALPVPTGSPACWWCPGSTATSPPPSG